jgi:hypothetical protein
MKGLPSQRLLETRRAAKEAQGVKGEIRDEMLHGGCDVESQVTARTFFFKKKNGPTKKFICVPSRANAPINAILFEAGSCAVGRSQWHALKLK